MVRVNPINNSFNYKLQNQINNNYVTFKENNYKQKPENNSFESKNKKKTRTIIGITASLTSALAVLVCICMHKGRKVLEGKESSFKERFQAGWKTLWGKEVKVDKGNKSTDKPTTTDKPKPDEKTPDEKIPDEKIPDEKTPDEKRPDEIIQDGINNQGEKESVNNTENTINLDPKSENKQTDQKQPVKHDLNSSTPDTESKINDSNSTNGNDTNISTQTHTENTSTDNTPTIISKFLKKTNYKESLDEMLKSNNEFIYAINDIHLKSNQTKEQIKKKLQQGDYETIYDVLTLAIDKSGGQGYWYVEPKATPVWDSIIKFLGSANEKIKDPVQAEKLKNIRVRAAGAKVFENKNTNPDLANAYEIIMKQDIANILFGKDVEAGNNKEEIVNMLATRIADYIYVPQPEKTLYNALLDVSESKLPSDIKESVIKLKSGISERYNIKTNISAEEYYNDYLNRFKSNSTDNTLTTIENAIMLFNKYLQDGEKLYTNADDNLIKSAYEKLAMQHHPDRCIIRGDFTKKNEMIFKEISKAYEFLTTIKQ